MDGWQLCRGPGHLPLCGRQSAHLPVRTRRVGLPSDARVLRRQQLPSGHTPEYVMATAALILFCMLVSIACVLSRRALDCSSYPWHLTTRSLAQRLAAAQATEGRAGQGCAEEAAVGIDDEGLTGSPDAAGCTCAVPSNGCCNRSRCERLHVHCCLRCSAVGSHACVPPRATSPPSCAREVENTVQHGIAGYSMQHGT